MENNFKFFENTDCEYYPCHKGIDSINCMFCYCPFYAWKECPGKNEFIDRQDGSRIKVCTNCNYPHIRDNRDSVIELLKMGPEKYYALKHPVSSKFYGIGVGPGNPDHITRQAEGIIRAIDVLILPAEDKERCRAYSIVKKAIPEIEGKECVFYPFPMSMKEPELSDFHVEVAKKVEEYLDKGKSVGFLSIGDVTIYSTFAYVEQIVSGEGYDTEYVSGIPSFLAAASRLNVFLTLGNDKMHIIPGRADIDEALKLDGTIVFMKSGKKLLELKQKLIEYEKVNDVRVLSVSNCGMENETVSENATGITEENGYLTVVIVIPYIV